MLSAEDILNKQDYKTEIVDVPEWGGKVKIKSLSAIDVDKLINNDDSMIIKAVNTVVSGCIDEAGNKLFTLDDVEKLCEKSQEPITNISHKILVITGLVKEDKKH